MANKKNSELTPMTKESHPEIMALYSVLCERAGFSTDEYKVFVEKSEKVHGRINTSSGEITLTTGLIENHTPGEVCAVIGHEMEHYDPNRIWGVIAYAMAGSTTFNTCILPYLDFHKFSQMYAAANLLAAMAGTSALIKMRKNELECDIGGAEFAGIEEMRSFFKRHIEANKTANKRDLAETLGIFSTHPSDKKRVANLEKFAEREDARRRVPQGYVTTCMGAE